MSADNKKQSRNGSLGKRSECRVSMFLSRIIGSEYSIRLIDKIFKLSANESHKFITLRPMHNAGTEDKRKPILQV